MDEAQQQHAAGVFDTHQQLLARTELDFVRNHPPLHQHRLAVGRGRDRVEMGFVFVAQRQVQHQVKAPAQAEFFEFLGQGWRYIERLAGEVVGMGHQRRLYPKNKAEAAAGTPP